MQKLTNRAFPLSRNKKENCDTVNPRISSRGAYYFKFRRRDGTLHRGGVLFFPNRGLTATTRPYTSSKRKQPHKLFKKLMLKFKSLHR